MVISGVDDAFLMMNAWNRILAYQVEHRLNFEIRDMIAEVLFSSEFGFLFWSLSPCCALHLPFIKFQFEAIILINGHQTDFLMVFCEKRHSSDFFMFFKNVYSKEINVSNITSQ